MDRTEREKLLNPSLIRLIGDALREDGAARDRTSAYLGLAGRRARADVVAGESGVLAGVEVARTVFKHADPGLAFDVILEDGAALERDAPIARVSGAAAAILGAERVALNFLQRLSGVATQTARFVEKLAPAGIRLLDTRKTTPLWRALERYAVRVGGGTNHRFNLADGVLIKENHVRAAGGIAAVVRRLAASPPPGAEIEVDSMEALESVLGSPVDRIMLDNFSPDDVRRAVALVAGARTRRRGKPVPEIEVSGGVTLDNVDAYVIPGVDFISVGALTHSVRALDISLEVVPDEC